MNTVYTNQKSPDTSRDAFDASNGNLPDNRKEIGLLVGNDSSALKILNITVRKLVRAGYKPVIYMAEHKPSTKTDAQQLELQNLGFYERYLTNNIIYPMLEKLPTARDNLGKPRTDIVYTPNQLAEVYELDIRKVSNINDKGFIDEIKNRKNMPLLTSIRCYQIAHEKLIETQTNKLVTLGNGDKVQGAFWNLHPGKLPEYQGIFGPLWAMNDLQHKYSWTLHEVIFDPEDPNKGIDKGNIITRTVMPIDYTKPAIENYLDVSVAAADMLYGRAEDFFSKVLPTTPQNEYKDDATQQYYSHPTEEFFKKEENWPSVLKRLVKLGQEKGFHVDQIIKDKVNSGITEPEIVNPADIIKLYTAMFVKESDPLFASLPLAIEKAVYNWELSKDNYYNAHTGTLGVVDHALVNNIQLDNVVPETIASPQRA